MEKSLPDNYKTKSCNQYFQTGKCNNTNCIYAHSIKELRPQNWKDPGMTFGKNGWYNSYTGHEKFS